jgi:sugar lactone lactonase YvrE
MEWRIRQWPQYEYWVPSRGTIVWVDMPEGTGNPASASKSYLLPSRVVLGGNG